MSPVPRPPSNIKELEEVMNEFWGWGDGGYGGDGGDGGTVLGECWSAAKLK